jgi:uncharacterized membrane protein (UPF0127 family)
MTRQTFLRAVISNRGTVLCEHLEVAASLIGKMIGLLGRSGLAPDQGLKLEGAWSIHTVGMRFSIDVVFLDKLDKVLAIHPDLAPGRLALSVVGATSVVELPAGTVEKVGLRVGDHVEFVTLDNPGQLP